MVERRETQTVVVDEEPIIDFKATGYFLGYLRRSMRRQRKLMVTTTVLTMAAVSLLCVVMPRVYRVSTRILTHKNLVMTALVHPDRAIPMQADAPTAGAVELIKSRENLENLMSDIKLQEAFYAKRSPIWKAKDRAMASLLGKPLESDVHEAFLKMLSDKLVATVESDVVTMTIEWPDPEIAMKLAEGSVARFLKLRHDMELSEIVETVNILERNVASSRQGIQEVVSRMQKVFDEKESELQSRAGAAAKERRQKPRKNRFVAIRKPIGPEEAEGAAAYDDLKKVLAEKQATIAQLRRSFDARVKKAQEDLANLRANLGPEHPDVVEAKRNFEALEQQPPELLALQAEEARMQAQLGTMPEPKASDGKAAAAAAAAGPQPAREKEDNAFEMMRVPVSEELYQQLDADPEIASIMEELKKRQDSHDELLRRLSNARIESETANVAFEYRYIMTEPPVFPKKAVKPNVPVLLGGGAVGAILLGIIFAVVSDIMSRRILESWQVGRFLNLKVLGEVDVR